MPRPARSIAMAATGLAIVFSGPARAADAAIAAYEIVGDAIPAPLAGRVGDAERGRRLAVDREAGNCLVCHQIPVTGEPSPGDLAPSLAGVGRRLDKGQMRLRLVDQSLLNPATLMPPYHRVEGLTRVAARYRGKPVFSAQDIEDVVAWLATLED
jgi:L-cysteine S-thiosulfotransferase